MSIGLDAGSARCLARSPALDGGGEGGARGRGPSVGLDERRERPGPPVGFDASGSENSFARTSAGTRRVRAANYRRSSARFATEDDAAGHGGSGDSGDSGRGGSRPNITTGPVELVGGQADPLFAPISSRGRHYSTCRPTLFSQPYMSEGTQEKGAGCFCAEPNQGGCGIGIHDGAACFSPSQEDDALEPPTPRSTERLHSPFWMPPAQEPPVFARPAGTRAQTAARTGTRSPARSVCHKSHRDGSRGRARGPGTGAGTDLETSPGADRGTGHGTDRGTSSGTGRGTRGSYSPPASRLRPQVATSTSRPTTSPAVTRTKEPPQRQGPLRKLADDGSDGGDGASRSAAEECAEKNGRRNGESASAGAGAGAGVRRRFHTAAPGGGRGEGARRDLMHVQCMRDRYLRCANRLSSMIV